MKTEKPDVTLTYKNNAGKMEWHMQAGAGKPEKGPGNYDKLVVGQGNDGIFTFAIKTKDITFDPTNPIEIKVANGGAGKPGQFFHAIVDGKLIVADPNSDTVPTDYYYKLNFVGADSLDPIITNGCCRTRDGGTGGVQLMSGTGVLAVLVAAVLLTSLYIAYTRWVK